MKHTLSLLAALFLAFSVQAHAATYYVAPPPLGVDTNAGSQAAPVATLARGIAISASGDTIRLQRGGIYREGGHTITGRTLGAWGDAAVALPVLSGAKVVTGWTATVGRPGVFQATLASGTPAQVYVNGALMTLARYPDSEKSTAFIEAARPVYAVLGAKNNVRLLNHRQGHRYPAEAQTATEELLDHHLKR